MSCEISTTVNSKPLRQRANCVFIFMTNKTPSGSITRHGSIQNQKVTKMLCDSLMMAFTQNSSILWQVQKGDPPSEFPQINTEY